MCGWDGEKVSCGPIQGCGARSPPSMGRRVEIGWEVGGGKVWASWENLFRGAGKVPPQERSNEDKQGERSMQRYSV